MADLSNVRTQLCHYPHHVGLSPQPVPVKEPLPLYSLGDGMYRALGIALALANARNGILLIDEFENGLYYTVQPDIWQLIFQVARRLNIQVFATTHSWDCIEAFQQAMQKEPKQRDYLFVWKAFEAMLSQQHLM